MRDPRTPDRLIPCSANASAATMSSEISRRRRTGGPRRGPPPGPCRRNRIQGSRLGAETHPVFAVILSRFLNLTRRNLLDHDGAGVHSVGRFSPFGPRGFSLAETGGALWRTLFETERTLVETDARSQNLDAHYRRLRPRTPRRWRPSRSARNPRRAIWPPIDDSHLPTPTVRMA